MARWVQLVLLVAVLQMTAGAKEEHRGPHSARRRVDYCDYGKEDYKITTKDGYKLTAFRLRSNVTGVARREPVLLQHGIATNGDSWFKLGRNSLPCVLARTGYDVWVANSRGSYYSREHIQHSPYFVNFWRFTLHEIAVNDLPPTIDYILSKTKRSKLSYVGDAVGGALSFIMLSEHRGYNAKVTVAVTFAPVCYTRADALVVFVTAGIFFARFLLKKKYAVALDLFKFFAQYIPIREAAINETISLEHWMNKPMDEDDKFFSEALKALDYAVSKRRSRSLLSYHLDITSIEAFLHYCQIVWSEYFAKFHRGFFGNLREYGTVLPPTYTSQLKDIRTPQFIIYSDHDSIVKGKGVRDLIGYLPKNVGKSHRVQRKNFGHFDFLYSRHAKQYVYDIAVRELNRYLPPPPTTPRPPTTPVNPECLVSK